MVGVAADGGPPPWPGRRSGRRPGAPLALGNVLIALGTLVLSASGTLNARLGAMTAFAVTLVLGIAVLFAGFLVTSAKPRLVENPSFSGGF